MTAANSLQKAHFVEGYVPGDEGWQRVVAIATAAVDGRKV